MKAFLRIKTNIKIQKAINLQKKVILFKAICQSAVDVLTTMNGDNVKQNGNEYQELRQSLKSLIKLFTRLTDKKSITQIQVRQTEQDVSTLMNSIINSYKSFDPEFSSTAFHIPKNSIIEDYQSFRGFLIIPQIMSVPEMQQKIDEIDQYLRQLDAPGSNARRSLSHPLPSSLSLSSPDCTKEFQDLVNLDSFTLSKDQYEKDQESFDHCHFALFYKGKMKETGEPVVITQIDEKDIDKFKRLYSLFASLNHSSLEIFKGASFTPPYEIVTQQNGESLHDVCSRRSNEDLDGLVITLAPNDRTKIAYQIANAMGYLHANRIIHRHLNSSNIMIDEDKNPQIINFSLSRFLPEDYYSFSNVPYLQSEFVAPELLADDSTYDEASDVFAFGGILYELLTGSAPFANDKNLKEKIINGKRPTIPNCSPALKKLIEDCWNHNPKLRPSFFLIIDKMASNPNLIFPTDDQNELRSFYRSHSIYDRDLRECFDSLEDIFNLINQSFVYTQELIRVRSILYSYFFLLHTNQYQLAFDSHTNYSRLKFLIQQLHVIIDNTASKQWEQIAIFQSPTDPTTDIYTIMSDLYNEMSTLHFKDHCKYEYVKADLLFDFRKIYLLYQPYLSEKPHLQSNIELIYEFLRQFDLQIDVTNEEINQTIQHVLYPFKDYQVDRNDFQFTENDIIGQGGSCTVYKAYQKSTNRYVAIKIFGEDYLMNNYPYLRRELALLLSLQESNSKYIVTFVGYNSGDDLWVITDLYQGDLYSAKFHLTPFQKTKIMFEIAEGMELLHSKQIVHRDLKTGNILLDGDTPIITDFGYARTNTPLDKTAVVGTYNYMAPEVLNRQSYGKSADVFSYSRILWELYSGFFPFQGRTDTEISALIKHGVQLPFTEPLSLELKDLIVRGCAFTAKDRPTFTDIINCMIDKKISYPGADPQAINTFYEEKKVLHPTPTSTLTPTSTADNQ